MFGQGALTSGVRVDKSLALPVNKDFDIHSTGWAYTLEDEPSQAMGDEDDRSVARLDSRLNIRAGWQLVRTHVGHFPLPAQV